jgi:hypothetical protein
MRRVGKRQRATTITTTINQSSPQHEHLQADRSFSSCSQDVSNAFSEQTECNTALFCLLFHKSLQSFQFSPIEFRFSSTLLVRILLDLPLLHHADEHLLDGARLLRLHDANAVEALLRLATLMRAR